MQVGAKAVKKDWSVYILKCSDGSLYTGVTTDTARRLAEHNGDHPGRGARYTRARRPVQLVWQESGHDRGSALRREYAVKRLRRGQKEQLLAAMVSSLADM
ncbi:MAG: GIY-YIG nuclease family protein [Oceanospirillales bacterium]|nr:GIY-YIG nuclease family protein [Oceanospirillales bacterium]